MGNTKSVSSKPENSGTVVNDIEIINQAEIVNKDIIVLIYIIVCVHIIKLSISLYKMWQRNLKKRYVQRAQSTDKL